jgi:uncharacterized repeat protein (TIGR03847 family)
VSKSFDLPAVQRLTVGTVGPVGKRAFYLQARQGDELVTLKVEKQLVGALSQRLALLLEDLPTVGDLPTGEALELEEPVLPEWPVGTLRIEYDHHADQVILVAEEVTEVDEEGEPIETGGMARFAATREQVAALVHRGAELVEAGRPLCPLCGYPLDPGGHSCPRTNGHRAPTL